MSNSLSPHGLYSLWNSPGQNIGESSLSLLQGIFLTQESNPGPPHCRWILYQLIFQGSPRTPQGKPKNPFKPPHYIDTVIFVCSNGLWGIFQFSLFLFFCSLIYIISLSTMYSIYKSISYTKYIYISLFWPNYYFVSDWIIIPYNIL